MFKLNSTDKSLLIFMGIVNLIGLAVCYFVNPSFWVWQLVCSFIFGIYLFLKNKLISGKLGEQFKNPIMYLSLQGGFFLTALFLIAIIMLAFKEEKKILLPIALINYLAFLIFDVVFMLKKKPLA